MGCKWGGPHLVDSQKIRYPQKHHVPYQDSSENEVNSPFSDMDRSPRVTLEHSEKPTWKPHVPGNFPVPEIILMQAPFLGFNM